MADYSKAGPDEERLARARRVMCAHARVERGPLSNRWVCLDCGEYVTELGEATKTATVWTEMTKAEFEAKYPKAQQGVPPIDTSQLGPVKIDYTRDQAMRDARVTNWRNLPGTADRVPQPPLDRAFYVAWRTLGDRWSVMRIGVGEAVPLEATHWCDDLLGLPACSD